jgi:hypothetical protein
VDTAFCPYSIFVCFVKIKSLCLIKHTPWIRVEGWRYSSRHLHHFNNYI